ncbi:DUF1440 domain-containing protein [Kordia sp.]|uniref:DUF1440 domain-containing protein n=1 Tax=Kordia sp. TaxID=1965332 RepID=UPI003B5998A8
MEQHKTTSFLSFDFTRSSSPTKTILWSGLISGILDSIAGVIVYYIYFNLNPLQVLQFIAAGVYGPEAINGGIGMILMGTFFHFLIAYVAAIIYFFAYPNISLLRNNKVLMGLLYGFVIWLFMNLLVLPNSNIPKAPFDMGLAIVGIVWHMVLVGLPIALITSKYLKKEH